MSDTSTKDFGPIRDDYRFFEEHATEADEDIRAYAPLVRAQLAGDRPVRMLDYGCGGGRFSTRFLTMANLSPAQLRLSLVEPVEAYRAQAAAELQKFTTAPIAAWPALLREAEAFDLILANHVFYYVKQLDEQLAALVRALAPRGLFLASMAGQENTLIQFWNRSFALIGQPVPFHTAEDLQASLDAQGIPCRRQPVRYQLAFDDSAENRLRIMRFLLGEYFAQMPRPALLALFDPYAAAGRVEMHVVHEQFMVAGSANDRR